MKKPFLMSAIVVATIGFTGCEDEDPIGSTRTPATINFAEEALQFSEGDDKSTIVLNFNRLVASNSTIVVRATSDHLSSFNFSQPVENNLISLSVLKGANSTSFDITPVNNTVLDGNKTITFSIESITGSLILGSKVSLVSHWLDDETAAAISFAQETTTLDEPDTNGKTITLALSHAAPGDGIVSIALQNAGAYGTVFTTEPQALGSVIQLAVTTGATSVSFKVLPVDDELFNATRLASFSITSATGAISKGLTIAHTLEISDDELTGMAKGYSTSAGTMGVSRTFIYAEDGKLASVNWTQNGISGNDTYHYLAEGELDKIVKSSGRVVSYIREGGKIVKSEEHVGDILKRYTLFGYDQANNVGETAIYDLQPDGSFAHSLHFVYLYHVNGNVYKKLAYYPVGNNPDDFELISTDTYEQYLTTPNMFGIEILPGKSIQPNLPATYTHQNGNQVLNYTLSYEFFPDGPVRSRTVVGQGGGETTQYLYY